MIRKRIVLALLGSLIMVVGERGLAQSPDSTTIPAYRKRLLGVYDDRTGDAIVDADVISVLNGMSMRTSSSGAVTLVILPDGGGLVRIRKVGYEPQTMMVSISPEDTTPLTIILKRVAELAAMSVVDSGPHYRSPGLQGFEERRQHNAGGSFLVEAAIRKEEARDVGNVLMAHFPNVSIKMGRGGRTFLLASPRCGKGGPPAVYLDGALLSKNPQDPAVDLNEFSLTQIAAIEYYPNTATAPPQFNATASSCGALLLWTREK